ncbi:MAG: ADP-ribosylglycohydrolase family protein, partial [Deferribacterales bacterium]
RPSGYVVSTLQTAVWLNLESMSFEEILAKTLIIGGDTDTIAAIACAIAGTIYGYNSIPDYLKNMVINVLINYPELYNYFSHYNF